MKLTLFKSFLFFLFPLLLSSEINAAAKLEKATFAGGLIQGNGDN